MDQGGRILHCLEHTLSAHAETIKAAESQLAIEAQQPGYGAVLCRIILANDVSVHLRQLAAVLLKQYVKQHWVEGERGFQSPETSEQEKQQIRQSLPMGLRDADSKIRTAVGVAIAAIANWDWPQAWPGLMEFVVNSIKERIDPNLMMGCLRCLGVMASDLDSEQAPELLQVLSPELAGIISSPNTPLSVTSTCFSIMAELAGALGSLSGAHQRQVRSMLVPLMQPWVPLICSALSSDVKDSSSWSTKHAALRLSQALVTYASKQLEASMPQLMGAAWQLLLAAQPLHQSILVEGNDEDADGSDVQGEADEHTSLEALLAQLFELLLSFVGPPRFRQQLTAAVPQLVYVSIAYLQMTQDQAETWAASANQFVADEEEDIVSCRASAELLLCELADELGSEVLAALLQGVGRRLTEADGAAAAGQQSWWTMREAAVMAVGSCCEQLEAAVMSRDIPALQLQQLLDTFLQRDLQPLLQQQQHGQLGDDGQQFIVGRCLWVGSKLCRIATAQQKEAVLQAAAAAVTANTSLIVTVNAFRALATLCPEASAQQMQPFLHPLLAALVQLLPAAGEESLHLVLEVLAAVIKAAAPASHSATAAGVGLTPEQAMNIAGPVLQAWSTHTSDPLIGPDAQEVIAAIASQPTCLPSLAAAAVPTLAGILRRGAAVSEAKRQGLPVPPAVEAWQDGPMKVEASLDLLGTLITPGQEAVAAEICRGVLGPVLNLIMASDDPSELSSAVGLLVQLMRSCPSSILLSCTVDFPSNASDPSTAVFSHILAVTRQLLSVKQQDGCSRDAGVLLVQLLKTFPEQLAAAPPAVVAAGGGTGAGSSCVGLLLHDVVLKMASSSCSPATLTSLLEFVVKLALMNVQQMIELLASMQVQQKDGSITSGLAVVFPIWFEHAPDLCGSLLTRQNTAALLQLLQLRHHPAVSGLMVQGVPMESPEAATGGRVTRSKAKQQGGLKYSQVPAPVKVLHVLGHILAADAEGGGGGRRFAGLEALGVDDDEDWEDESDDEAGGGGDMRGLAQLMGTGIAGLAAAMSPGGDINDMLDRSEAATPLPEDPLDAEDPLLRTSLRSKMHQGLTALMSSDPGFMSSAAAQLGDGRELQALQQLMSAEH